MVMEYISTELSRVIVDGPGSITRVTVTVRLREAGNYQCTVSNDRVTASTINGVTAVSSTSSLSIGGKYNVSMHPSTTLTVKCMALIIRNFWKGLKSPEGKKLETVIHINSKFGHNDAS